MLMQNRASLFVFIGLRWILLLLGFIIYYGNNERSSAGLMLAAVSVQAVYSLFLLNKPSTRLAAIAVSFDMLFQIYLLWSAGGLTGPFICYSLFGLFILGKYFRWKSYYAITLAYLLLIPVLLSFLDGNSLQSYVTANSTYLIYITLFYGAAATVQYSSLRMAAHIHTLVKIYTSRKFQVEPGNHKAIRYAEELLKEIIANRGVWLCIPPVPGSHEQEQSWVHSYYSMLLEQAPPAAPKAYAQLTSLNGEPISLYIRTLHDRNGKRYGWLLIQADQNELTSWQQAYIQLVLMKFEAYYDISSQIETSRDQAIAIERSKIAQDIHDGIAQELFFLSVQLFQLKNTIQGDDRDRAMPLLLEMESKVKESHRDIRKFIVELKGERSKYNLQDAIESMLRRITDHTDVKVVFENKGWVPKERVELEETIYRLIEEAANNVIKHAKASNLLVRIEVTRVQWTIFIKDDGIGMKYPAEGHSGKLGISGMINRVKALNGSISVHSEELMGTTITATIPRERSLAHV